MDCVDIRVGKVVRGGERFSVTMKGMWCCSLIWCPLVDKKHQERGVVRVWDKTGEDCPSHAGKGDKEREMKAKRRERGQIEGVCMWGED